MTKDAKERRAFLSDVAGLWPAAKGSLAQVRRPCIRPTCPACARGDKHPAWIFTFRQKGRQRCLYVRPAFVEMLRRAIGNGRRIEDLLTREGVALVERRRLERPGGVPQR
jgi:hypothetical protein